jgi:prepilin-type N-terminal cleavage/methylation domain-containing protein
MKTKINSLRNAECGMRNENAAASGINSLRTSHFALRTSPAFTLIELLVVISIIAILATFTIHGMKTIKRKEYINKTQAEMAQLETAIDSYKATHGFYPPSNPAYNPANSATWSDAYFNPLYFELLGTTNNTTTGIYLTLDGSASIPVAALTVPGPLGVGGFINCTKPGTGEDAVAAKNFLLDLSSKQILFNFTNTAYPTYPVTLLVASVGGPDPNYQPMGPNTPGVNPWRYVNPGINNPSSYDLWAEICIGGQTNLVCNWAREVQKNTTLP